MNSKYDKKLTPKAVWNTFVAGVFMRGLTYLIVIAALGIFTHIIYKGAPVVFKAEWPLVNTDFLTKTPESMHVFRDAKGNEQSVTASKFEEYRKIVGEENIHNDTPVPYAGGGISGPIVGTALLVLVTMTIALFFGVASAIYLSEYSKPTRFIAAVRLAIINLAGVPSVVFGMFGFALFVLFVPTFTNHPEARSLLKIPLGFNNMWISFEGWGSCVLSGACTLACMILPVIITASEETLRGVPREFRSASLALGATQFQTIRKVVLPYALPGILTSSIIGIARVAGETAPIMFTAAVAYKDRLPWEGLTYADGTPTSNPFALLFQNVQALPYHIYTVATKIPDTTASEHARYGAVFVFMVLVMSLAGFSVYLRAKLREKYKW